MVYISNEERKNKIKKLQSADHGKRIFVTITIIVCIVFLAFVFILGMLSFLPDDIQSGIKKFVGDGSWVIDGKLTNYGILMITMMSVTLAMLITSLVIFLSMKTLRWGFKNTVNLMSTPIPGKSGKVAGTRAKSIVNERISVDKVKKGKRKLLLMIN